MNSCAFLTMSDPGGYVIDDELAFEPLRRLKWRVEEIPWQKRRDDWATFDLVIIRSPWDYMERPAEFLEVLAEIEGSGTLLCNELALVRWNLHKTYLRVLATRGVSVVPTQWRDRLEPGDLGRLLDSAGDAGIVVKPMLSASAKGAFRIDPGSVASRVRKVEDYFAETSLMVQPFIRSVVDEGEYSLIYIDGEFSHAVVKTPRSGDFRVQEEHGGFVHSFRAERALLSASATALGALEASPLYARTDFVRAPDGETFWLMELELIEPSLYLRMDPDAPARLARAIAARGRGSGARAGRAHERRAQEVG